MSSLLDLLQAASNSAASNVSAPVDAIAWLLKKAGIDVGTPVGGSDWMERRGLTRPVQQSGASLAGETAGLLAGPLAAAKAPQIAKGLLQGAENMAAAPNVNRGMSAGQRGIFGGELAKTADKQALSKAQEMERSGIDARTIWNDTGWFRGGDKKWRFEIDDSGSKLLDNKAAMEFMAGPGPAEYPLGSISNLLEHKAASSAYPDAMAIKARMKKGDSGAYLPNTGFGEGFDLPSNGTHSTALHELQHAIQRREGFANGGSPSGMQSLMSERADIKAKFDRALEQFMTATDPIAKSNAQQEMTHYGVRLGRLPKANSAEDAYIRLAGEAEARAVQSRMNMTPAQRRATFPLDSYDVPIDQLIYR